MNSKKPHTENWISCAVKIRRWKKCSEKSSFDFHAKRFDEFLNHTMLCMKTNTKHVLCLISLLSVVRWSVFRFSIHTPNHNIKEHKKRTQPRRQTTRWTFWRFAHPRNTLTSVVDSLARHKWALNTIISDTLTQFIFTLIFLLSSLISLFSFCETKERKILAIEVPWKSLGSCVFPRRFRIF